MSQPSPELRHNLHFFAVDPRVFYLIPCSSASVVKGFSSLLFNVAVIASIPTFFPLQNKPILNRFISTPHNPIYFHFPAPVRYLQIGESFDSGSTFRPLEIDPSPCLTTNPYVIQHSINYSTEQCFNCLQNHIPYH